MSEEEGRVHPDCRNASNPFHKCSEYCFRIISEAKKQLNSRDTGITKVNDDGVDSSPIAPLDECETLHDQRGNLMDHSTEANDVEDNEAGDFTNLTGPQKKLFELRLRMNEARKANQTAMVQEKKRMEPPEESRGISKEKWLEQRKNKIGRLLDSNGLDMSKAYMLDTEEMAQSKYKKWEKDPAPVGWDVFNQKTLYDAYKKRAKKIDIDIDEYNKMKEADPEFYRDASSLQYGKAPKISDEKIEKMVKDMKDREEKRNAFSRRRRYREEKDIDSINDRNEHFNKKIERAFGKYTLEIKNNLERGTALPD